ncbi:hypothetical protein AFEL58S_02696 [Afipia felis]
MESRSRENDIQVLDQKSCIFENAQGEQIANAAPGQQAIAAPIVRTLVYPQTKPVVYSDRNDQKH